MPKKTEAKKDETPPETDPETPEVEAELEPETPPKREKKPASKPAETPSDWKKFAVITTLSIGGLWLLSRGKHAPKTEKTAPSHEKEPAGTSALDRLSPL